MEFLLYDLYTSSDGMPKSFINVWDNSNTKIDARREGCGEEQSFLLESSD